MPHNPNDFGVRTRARIATTVVAGVTTYNHRCGFKTTSLATITAHLDTCPVLPLSLAMLQPLMAPKPDEE